MIGLAAAGRIRDAIRRARDEGAAPAIWWRDDDAVAPTPQLDRLIALAKSFGMPVGLAVIPQSAQPALAERLREEPGMLPMVHGLGHVNHAPAGQKKAEFGADRPQDALAHDATRALYLHRRLFGADAAPWFVPPWNRIDAGFAASLGTMGYRGLSAYRGKPPQHGGIARLDTHLDPIDWRGSRGALDGDIFADHAIEMFRRTGADRSPVGLLTHHLVHDEDVWALVARWFDLCLAEGILMVNLGQQLKQDTGY